MPRALIAVAVLASLVASSAALPFLQVSLTFDNRASHAQSNERAVVEELAKELCFTDKSKVAAVRLFDENSAINTQSRGVYACFPSKYTLDKMLECRTSPDLEVEKFQCTICDTNALTANGPCYAKTATPVRIEKPLPSRG